MYGIEPSGNTSSSTSFTRTEIKAIAPPKQHVTLPCTHGVGEREGVRLGADVDGDLVGAAVGMDAVGTALGYDVVGVCDGARVVGWVGLLDGVPEG